VYSTCQLTFSLRYLAHLSPNFTAGANSPKFGFDFLNVDITEVCRMGLGLDPNSGRVCTLYFSPVRTNLNLELRVDLWRLTSLFVLSTNQSVANTTSKQ